MEYNDAMYQLCIELQKAYVSISRDVLYNILIEFGIPMKLVRLIKTCLNELAQDRERWRKIVNAVMSLVVSE
jgi:hypothetical protein